MSSNESVLAEEKLAAELERMKTEGENEAGAVPPAPTAEESLAARRKLFEEHPEQFYHQDEIIMAAIKMENGTVGICHGAVSRMIMESSLTRINYKTMMIFQMMDMQRELAREQKDESPIITGSHNGAPVYGKPR